MTNSQKVVTPVETGVQRFYSDLKALDSGLRRNDGEKASYPKLSGFSILNYRINTIFDHYSNDRAGNRAEPLMAY
jgi:hypothetical protein